MPLFSHEDMFTPYSTYLAYAVSVEREQDLPFADDCPYHTRSRWPATNLYIKQ